MITCLFDKLMLEKSVNKSEESVNPTKKESNSRYYLLKKQDVLTLQDSSQKSKAIDYYIFVGTSTTNQILENNNFLWLIL